MEYPPGRVLAAHRLVARHDVLDRSREEMPVVRKARRERRPVVEPVALLALVLLQRLFKRLVGFPEREDLFLHLRKGPSAGSGTQGKSIVLAFFLVVAINSNLST